MGPESRYFELSMESLRAIGGWAADCAERVLRVYEARPDSDERPRAAIDGIREFAAGGKRTAWLRTLALGAHAAAREIGDPAASAAARAAGTAAASAYTHPLADVHQTKHVVGTAAYAALALVIEHGGDPSVADAEVRWAIEHAPAEARDVLMQMPAREPGKSRFDTLLYELDAGIRARGAGPVLRGFEASDAAAVHDLIGATIDACYPGHYSPRAVEFFKRFHSPEAITRRAEAGIVLVAEDGGGIVATGALVDGEIGTVFVLPRAQGAGVGAAMMGELERAAVRAGLRSVELDVSLPSRGFYERRGYRVIESRSIDVGEGETLDYWRAVKPLTSES